MRRCTIRAVVLCLFLLIAIPAASASERLSPRGVDSRTGPKVSSTQANRAASKRTLHLEGDDSVALTVGSASAVAVGDVNGDGLADLLATNENSPCGCPLNVFVQNPDGSLDDPITLATTSTFRSESGIGLGDLDGDDDVDVAVAVADGVDWFEQSGGGLQDAVHLPSLFSNGNQVAIADLDGDGLNDIIEVGTQLDVWFNSAAGFDTVTTVAQVSVDELEVGDVTGDGAPDVVLGDGHVISVWENQDDGTGDLSQPDEYEMSSTLGGFALGDGNGDGLIDVMAGVGGNADSKMNFFRQTTAGHLANRVVYESKDVPDSATVADLNHDSRDDLIVGHGTWVTFGVYLQKVDGTFAGEELYPTDYFNIEPKGIAAGDLNDDGKVDIVLGDSTGQVHVFRQARALSISAPNRTRYGHDVDWSVRLADPASTANKTVSVYAVTGGPPTLLETGTVDSKGRLDGTYENAKRNVVLRVEWDGDGRASFTTAKTMVGVRVTTTAELRGSSGSSGRYHLYPSGVQPTYVGTVKPNHHGHKLFFTLQRRASGGWLQISTANVKIAANGSAGVRIRGLRTGIDYRVQCRFNGDDDHVGDAAPWSYLRVA